MIQREWRGAVGTAGLGYWTHEPDGALPLAPVGTPDPMGISRKGDLYTYIQYFKKHFLFHFQVRDEYRTDFDSGRGGYGQIMRTKLDVNDFLQ